MKTYIYHIAIAADQLLNASLGGFADETLSSRIWRNNQKDNPKARWRVALIGVNSLFFWQKNHCKGAYQAEINRKHMPNDLRANGK